jgi:hypothetical protein
MISKQIQVSGIASSHLKRKCSRRSRKNSPFGAPDLTHAWQQRDLNGNPPLATCRRGLVAWPGAQA